MLAPISSCIFGILAASNETKKDVTKTIVVNGNLQEVKSRELNSWGKISLVGLIISMLFSVSTKSIKIITDDITNTEKQRKDSLAASDAMDRYNKSIKLQKELKDSSRIILDSMKASLATQRILLGTNKRIQNYATGILGIQRKSLSQQRVINLNTKRLLTPLFPMAIAVNFDYHLQDLSLEQKTAFREIKEKVEAGIIHPDYIKFSNQNPEQINSISLSNVFSSDSDNKYVLIKNQLILFEPAMRLIFDKKLTRKTANNTSDLTIRFSRNVNGNVIPHTSYMMLNFNDSTIHVNLFLKQIENATNNDNFLSIYDLQGSSLRIETFLNRRPNNFTGISMFRINSGFKSFKDIYLKLSSKDRIDNGFYHIIMAQELALE